MKPMVYRFVLIFVILTVVATIGLQLHWNIKNYQENRQRVMNDIQIAFDIGVENYYAEGAKRNFRIFLDDSLPRKMRRNFRHRDSSQTGEVRFVGAKDSIPESAIRVIRKGSTSLRYIPIPPPDSVRNISVQLEKGRDDDRISDFTSRIIVAMLRDSIDFAKLDSLFAKEIGRKDIAIAYGFEYKKPRKLQRFGREVKVAKPFVTSSKSTYLPPGHELKLRFSDPFYLVLSRSMTEIILSLLLSLSIIGCMLYLLRIINRQKKIEEIRNDLISNITHEFKTPITTIGSAIEGIRSFNQANDKEKTERYLDISEKQLGKLQTMVEKLLDTATLDSGEIVLKKEPVDIVALLNTITERHLIGADAKIAVRTEAIEPVIINADAFHLENAISNLIDNAVKYGGDEINIRLEQPKGQILIFVEDDGVIDHWHRDQIFEKFYRIPTGNVHNVKGFGIGLYYSRKIVEKHDGRLELLPGNKTVFKITLPDA